VYDAMLGHVCGATLNDPLVKRSVKHGVVDGHLSQLLRGREPFCLRRGTLACAENQQAA
jgi:hypothetical protein